MTFYQPTHEDNAIQCGDDVKNRWRDWSPERFASQKARRIIAQKYGLRRPDSAKTTSFPLGIASSVVVVIVIVSCSPSSCRLSSAGWPAIVIRYPVAVWRSIVLQLAIDQTTTISWKKLGYPTRRCFLWLHYGLKISKWLRNLYRIDLWIKIHEDTFLKSSMYELMLVVVLVKLGLK